METAARALLGAASGGIFGLLIGGMAGATAGRTVMLMAVLGAAVGAANVRRKATDQPAAPRAALAAIVAAIALLTTLGVYMGQALYIESQNTRGVKVTLPLPIWPTSAKVLWVAVFLAILGGLLALLGWVEVARERGRYSGGRWVALAILAGVSTVGLAASCYLMGHGFSL